MSNTLFYPTHTRADRPTDTLNSSSVAAIPTVLHIQIGQQANGPGTHRQQEEEGPELQAWKPWQTQVAMHEVSHR